MSDNIDIHHGSIQLERQVKHALPPYVRLALWILIEAIRDIGKGTDSTIQKNVGEDALEYFRSGAYQDHLQLVQCVLPWFDENALKRMLENPADIEGKLRYHGKRKE